ncbi:MAG TPA: hypothetical protein VD906_03845 [Caulobacteraceae bacterium]|nr:hypothetical protein [Caulobacteraceae bacterium]
MKIAALAGALALGVSAPALAQTAPTVSAAFNNSCIAEAVPAGAICRVVGTATLAGGEGPARWSLYELVGSGGRSGLSVLTSVDGKLLAKTPVPGDAVEAWAREPYVVASTIKEGDTDYAVMWMRGDDKPSAFSVHRIEASGALTPVDSAPLWGAIETRIAGLTTPDCYTIDTDIAWRSFGLRYDMMGDAGSCGVAFLELGVEEGIVKVTDALVVRNDVVTPKRRRPRRR